MNPEIEWIVSEDFDNTIHPSIRKLWDNRKIPDNQNIPDEIVICMWI